MYETLKRVFADASRPEHTGGVLERHATPQKHDR